MTSEEKSDPLTNRHGVISDEHAASNALSTGQSRASIDVAIMIRQINSASQFLSELQDHQRYLRSQLEDSIERENVLTQQLNAASQHAANLERELRNDRLRLTATESALRAAQNEGVASAKDLSECERKLTTLATAIELAFSELPADLNRISTADHLA